MSNRAANLYRLAHNSQVCYLQAELNDTFDKVVRRIFIGDPIYIDPLYIYLSDESKPVFIDLVSEVGSSVIADPDPVPLYTDMELTVAGGGVFVINVPAVLGLTAGQVLQLKALATRDKLPGTVYTIKYF